MSGQANQKKKKKIEGIIVLLAHTPEKCHKEGDAGWVWGILNIIGL